MKKILSILVLVLMLGIASGVKADVIEDADGTTLWSNITFTGPYTNKEIAVSNAITNTSGTHDSIEVVIEYLSIIPEGSTVGVHAILEEEIASGTWIPVAEQFERINASDSRPLRIIKLQPVFDINEGADYVGNTFRQSRTNGVLPAKVRVRLIDDTNNQVTSVKINGYFNKYNYR